ncbi:ABC transporter permease [Geomicrobium sp. JCM 19055]|uniref:ABC transporter permease n=1 Tax=Geomicrobium sp. JCM 19055 TaxID=1460649 RepID=UPI00045ED446|nr:ABC transporter, permease protein EscB [Geomicrobium sp. JCM 19055]
MNWQWLIDEEERALVRNYKFINFFIDVPNLKRSFRRRRLLTMILKRCIPSRRSHTFVYLYSQLFVRHNDYFYLYLRLTAIGIVVNYAMPANGGVFNLLVLFMTGSQVTPLQYELNQSVTLYPISEFQRKDSFLTFVLIMLYTQLAILFFATSLTSTANLFNLFIGGLFVHVFVYFFVAKRVNVLGSAIKR